MSSKTEVQQENYLDLSLIKDNGSNGKSQAQSLQDCFKGINLNPLAGVFTQIKESPLVETVKQMAEVNQRLTEQIVKINIGLDQTRSVMETIAKTIPNLTLAVPQIISASLRPIKDFGGSLSAIFDTISIPNFFSDWTKQLKNMISKLFNFDYKKVLTPFTDFLEALRSSNFLLIVKVSEGEESSTKQLGILWVKIKILYFKYCRLQGEKPTQESFHAFLSQECKSYLELHADDPAKIYGFAKAVFNYIIVQLCVDYVDIIENKSISYNDDFVNLKDLKFHIEPYVENPEYGKVMFTKMAGRQIEASAQTIRNYMNEGLIDIKMIKTSHISTLKQRVLKTHLLPYSPALVNNLYKIKLEKENKKLHRKPGFYTIAQVSRLTTISRKTLERWDAQDILSPRRIKNIRYYTQEEIDQIAEIFCKNNSPKFRALKASFATS